MVASWFLPRRRLCTEGPAVGWLAQQLIGILKLISITHATGFDIYGSTGGKSREAKSGKLNEKRIVEYVVRRMKTDMRVTKNSYDRK